MYNFHPLCYLKSRRLHDVNYQHTYSRNSFVSAGDEQKLHEPYQNIDLSSDITGIVFSFFSFY